MSTVTNGSTRFTPFTLALANGGTVTGIAHIVPHTAIALPATPLIIGIHGGTCTAHNFDVDPRHTASLASVGLGVPFVAFDRPGYGGTTSFYPIPASSSYYEEDGRWMHDFIFPALWEEFGRPNGCCGIVPLCHSLGVPGTIIAAAKWVGEGDGRARTYPLVGMIFSGWGTRRLHATNSATAAGPNAEPIREVTFPTEVKKVVMLSDDKYRCYEPDVLPCIEAQNVSMKAEEVRQLSDNWHGKWHKYGDVVDLPIMYAVGEHDWLWEGTWAHVREYEQCWPQCPRFDGSVVAGAPHALEWSLASQGWYARCFGWAMEICAGQRMQRLSQKSADEERLASQL